MKKTLFSKGSLCLSTLLVLGLAACGGSSSQSSGKDTSSVAPSQSTSGQQRISGNLDEGMVTNYQDPKTVVATRPEDTRTVAYAAKTAEGTEIGQFKTIAEAINAAVEYDVEKQADFDSIVTKIGSERKIFQNRPGYSEDNNDQYWFYENGTSLDAYNCWDGSDTVPMLRNSSYITNLVTAFGQSARQTWNSYTLLDEYGEEFEDGTFAQSYELSSTMDAGLISFHARRAGITKLHYEIDLSSVKIAPSYKGCDKTYAFIGFYAWQDYYVIANGIACDTTTGNWYQFIGSSRDDSFSDVEYNLGACVLTSTYNEKGGYFVPDSDKLTLEIESKRLYDEEWQEYYQIDYICIEAEGAGKFEREISDSTVNMFFKNTPLSIENSYVFIAGLDIKPEDELEDLRCMDYFNGSYFTGLTVTKAYGYVPTEEELDDFDYGFTINKEWRGKNHDLILSNTVATPGFLDYNVLNTGYCCDYMGLNGKDVYDFSYAKKSTSSNLLGKNAREYQDVIDSLDTMTKEDLIHDPSTLNLVGTWYNDEKHVIFHQKYWNVLNWQPYFDALERLGQIEISEAAKKVIAEMEVLEIEDYKEFGKIYEDEFLKLNEGEQSIVKIKVGKDVFESSLSLYNFYKELKALDKTTELPANYVFIKGDVVSKETKQWKAEDTLDELLFLLKAITKPTKWTGELEKLNDDPNSAGCAIMNVDNNLWPSVRAYFIESFYDANELEVPEYIENLALAAKNEEFIEGFVDPIYGTAKVALRIEKDSLTKISELTEEELAFLNEVWTNDYVISDLIEYSWNNPQGAKFETWYSARTRAITLYAGGDGVTKTKEYFETVADFLEGCGYTVKENGWGVTASVIN